MKVLKTTSDLSTLRFGFLEFLTVVSCESEKRSLDKGIRKEPRRIFPGCMRTPEVFSSVAPQSLRFAAIVSRVFEA